MKTTAYRGIDKLTYNLQQKVTLFLAEVNKDSEVIFITETWRSEERQVELIKAGLSQVKHSNHQDGKAIDIAFRGDSLYPWDNAKWRAVADIAKKYGIDWGYDLWQWDKPHFQDNGLPILPLTTPPMRSKYTDIMTAELKAGWLSPLFTKHEGDTPLTEQEVKELGEIMYARIYARLKKEFVK